MVIHVVIAGQCLLEAHGQAPVPLAAGDAILLPRGDAHVLSPQPAFAGTEVLSGYMWSASGSCLMLGALPPAVRVPTRRSEADGWLEAAMRCAQREAGSSRPGREAVLARLAEILLIEVMRLHADTSGEAGKDWFTRGNDRIVSAALDAIHRHPERGWTLASLARHVGSSRSVLAKRFQERVGTTTMHYLTQWRMSLAANLLCRSDSTLLRIAGAVGYETDTAFSRAFRREYGMPPATWRRRRGTTHAVPAGTYALEGTR